MQRLTLYRPLKTLNITQMFGEDNACTNGNLVIGRPQGKECPIGYYSLYKSVNLNGHNGHDYAAPDWTPIYSATEGVVSQLSPDKSLGLGISITTENQYVFSEGVYYAKLRYWHLAGYNVKKGDRIVVGQLIGWADNTGNSTGSHLHFDLKPELKDENGDFYNAKQDNGYLGAIDPLPYLSQMSAWEINNWLTKIRYSLVDLMNRWQTVLGK